MRRDYYRLVALLLTFLSACDGLPVSTGRPEAGAPVSPATIVVTPTPNPLSADFEWILIPQAMEQSYNNALPPLETASQELISDLLTRKVKDEIPVDSIDDKLAKHIFGASLLIFLKTQNSKDQFNGVILPTGSALTANHCLSGSGPDQIQIAVFHNSGGRGGGENINPVDGADAATFDLLEEVPFYKNRVRLSSPNNLEFGDPVYAVFFSYDSDTNMVQENKIGGIYMGGWGGNLLGIELAEKERGHQLSFSDMFVVITDERLPQGASGSGLYNSEGEMVGVSVRSGYVRVLTTSVNPDGSLVYSSEVFSIVVGARAELLEGR